jgi:dTDP-4-amino-4,6-dideoxygalactose transaminase
LENLDSYVERKRAIARVYTQELAGLPGLRPLSPPPGSEPAFWLYTVLIDPAQARLDSRALMAALAQEGIQSRPLWQPLHLSPAHEGAQVVGGRVAERLWKEALSLPSSVGLSQGDQARVIEAVERLMG